MSNPTGANNKGNFWHIFSMQFDQVLFKNHFVISAFMRQWKKKNQTLNNPRKDGGLISATFLRSRTYLEGTFSMENSITASHINKRAHWIDASSVQQCLIDVHRMQMWAGGKSRTRFQQQGQWSHSQRMMMAMDGSIVRRLQQWGQKKKKKETLSWQPLAAHRKITALGIIRLWLCTFAPG